jgi:hypothetical protein
MSSTADHTCEHARDWLSAARDGEADHDPSLAAHVDDCASCTNWASQLDVVTRTTRLRAPIAPAHLRGALPALAGAPVATGRRTMTVARALLAAAAFSGLAAVLLGMAGVAGHAHLGSIDGRDAWGMKLALLVGFAITAWRPERNAAGLLPIASIAALVTVVMSVLAWPSSEHTLLGELLHVPILLGAAGAVLAFTASTRTAPTAATAGAVAPATHA